ncbi:MAG: hypothetical protein NZ908_01520 [Candidatus Micrarchaeota archaeon]|nr:hypothetical protein [Candidatus Micrarchaeota archaeon]MCX8154377.1 hypothetical protein [Candidatus Micrarchaeota archaeon]
MSFEARKRSMMEKLKYYLDHDEVDEPIIDLIRDINSIPKAFTTSSCSGRVIVLIDRGRKIDSEKYLTFHRYITIEDLKDIPRSNNVWLRVEPFILHLITKDIDTADSILRAARSVGIKRGGMQRIKVGYFIELMGNVNLSVPTSKCIIDEELVGVINTLMRKNFRMLERFHLSIKELIENIQETGNH